MKPITQYKPIDYNNWNQSGQGNNIKRLFTPIERNIWDRAFPYQDKRDDVGHIEHVVYFAFKLLEYIDAKRVIVIPAAIFHDTGWGLLFEDSQWSRQLPGGPLQRYDPFSEDFKRNETIYRDLHQKAGVEIATRILEDVNYPQEYRPTIAEIVAQHDTRKGFFCPEDGIVRDADKLWRFTLRQTQMAYYAKETPKRFLDDRSQELEKPGLFYSEVSRHIARVELGQTMKYLMRNRR